MKLTKHIGLHKGVEAEKDKRIVLLIPFLENHEECLVAYLDYLPGDLKDALLHILNSDEGQRETDFSKALSTRLFADSGTSVLQTLHTQGHIKKLPINDVVMTPSTAYNIPLRVVLESSGLIPAKIDGIKENFNPHQHNAEAANHGEAVGTARNLLVEADLLEQAAREKREKAYLIAPTLRPKTKGKKAVEASSE